MSPAAAFPPPTIEPTKKTATAPTGESARAALLARVRSALAAYAEEPSDAGGWAALLAVRRDAAALIAAIPSGQKSGAAVEAAFQLIELFAASGASDQPARNDDLALAKQYLSAGWPGLLAAMLLVPACQLPEAPKFDAVPGWLWPKYTAYVFHVPQGFTAPGQAATYAAAYLRRLEELAGWAAKNRGASAVREALTVFCSGNNCIPLYFTGDSLRRHYELRARILTLALVNAPPEEMPALPRLGRRLRVGFVNRHFGSQTETYTTIPSFEQLDPERFEVVLFAHHTTGSPVEDYARAHAAAFHVLPAALADQLALLRSEWLDVVVFGTNLTAVCHEVTTLALHRVAPLQVANNSSCTTTGLPQVDLYVSGDLTESAAAPAHFSERLGLLPGPAHAFNYEADRQEPSGTPTRELLQIPADALLFVSAANYFKITPEMQHAWAKLLAAVPGSRLLVHPFNPNWSSSYPIKRFCAEFDRVLAAHGVDPGRLHVSTLKFPSRSDVTGLMALGDVYLDTFPFAGVNSLVDPLEAAIPVVTWEGETFRSRMGAGLLRSLGLTDLITRDADGYHALAVRLAGAAAQRDAWRTQIREKMARAPLFLDPLAASEAFGDLLVAAYDELEANGREAFRANPQPVRAAASGGPAREANLFAGPEEQARATLRATPNDAKARHALGRELLAAGRADRAVAYLLAALEGEGANPVLWFDVARALRANHQMQQAIEALETCLRVDGSHLDGWLLLAEISQAVGSTDMAREAAAIARQLAPADPRPAAYL
ncbi:MAG: tetratricopeptide repeat protein [Opitutae bacterium]|nr:tetratricopeptide repeat protein [Opitutae bacterium]